MSSYISSYPEAVEVDPSTKGFFETFYRISDTPDAHEAYAEQFTSDATLIMASKKCQGAEGEYNAGAPLFVGLPDAGKEILALRKGMWEKVASRSHNAVKVFPFGANSDELMLFGTVDYKFKDGGSASVDWAARALVVKEREVVRMRFYQVYLDTAAANARK